VDRFFPIGSKLRIAIGASVLILVHTAGGADENLLEWQWKTGMVYMWSTQQAKEGPSARLSWEAY
jgi:hypothetical protein